MIILSMHDGAHVAHRKQERQQLAAPTTRAARANGQNLTDTALPE